jgi:hypothetical protein
LAILFSPFGFIAPKALNYLAFKFFNIERIWFIVEPEQLTLPENQGSPPVYSGA